MAGPFSTPRSRTSSITSDIGDAARSLAARLTSPSSKPDVSPNTSRRGARGSLGSFFATKSERNQTTVAAPSANVASSSTPASGQSVSVDPPKTVRPRSSPRPNNFIARSLTGRPRPLSRVEASPANSPTLQDIFAALPSRTQDRIRSSYDSARRSFGRPEAFALGDIAPIPDVPDPETPTSSSHSFRLSGSSDYDSTSHPKRHSMASFVRPPITSRSARRVSSLPFDGGDGPLDTVGEPYRASTADLREFLRDTGPEDSYHPNVKKSPSKDLDRDGSSSTRSRSKSSIFRIARRKREKSRPSVGSAASANDGPPVPAAALPRPPVQQKGGEVRPSFPHILPLRGLNREGADSPGTGASLQDPLSGWAPPNTREHRLPNGTTILMITTPQATPQPTTLSHSRSLGSMTGPAKEGTSESTTSSVPSESEKVVPQLSTVKPLVNHVATKLRSHSPTMSVSSDDTLSTTERPGVVPGEDGLALLPCIRTLETHFSPPAPATTHATTGGSVKMNTQSGYLQVHVIKTRPRGYSSPDPISPPSAESTPAAATLTPTFSPSASIAPTPELTPHRSPVKLLEPVPVVAVNVVSPRKSPIGSPIIVGGLEFPAPPVASPRPRRCSSTIGTSPRGNPSVSPSRTTNSMRVTRSPRSSNPSEGDSVKARAKKIEHGPRPHPLNLDSVPTYRELKANPALLQTHPGELTGLELDLSAGSSELGRKRDSLMEQHQHQQFFLNVDPFQTPPSPSDPFLGTPLKNASVLPPPVGGPPAMPLPPSPRPLPEPPTLSSAPISPRSNSLPMSDLRRTSPHSQRSRLDSLRVRSSAWASPIPASPVTSDAVHTLSTILTAQRDQFDSMSKHLVDMVKSFEEEKRAYEQRIQELMASVAEKEAKSKEDERKIKGLEWLVGNLNLRAGVGKGGNNRTTSSDSESTPAGLERRRGSFSGLGVNDDVPVTPLPVPISQVFNPAERARRTASMDDVLQNLIALSLPPGGFGSRSQTHIHEWAAKTVLEQD